MDYSLHKGTPTVTVRDNRGLDIREIGYHRHPDSPSLLDERVTRHEFNALGQLAQSIDPRLHQQQCTDASVSPNYRFHTSLTGEVLCTESVDAGTTRALGDVLGREWLSISATGVIRRWHYENPSLAGRLVAISEQVADEKPRITERLFWCEATQAAKGYNLAGRCVRHYDTAGCVQTDSVGLTQALQSSTRKLLAEGLEADWQGQDESAWDNMMTPYAFTTSCRADATGTQVRQRDALGHTQRQAYDIAGRLASSQLKMKGGLTRVIVRSMTYSAAGHKLREEQGNGVVTTYTYEPQTQRLAGSKVERVGGQRGESKVLQDLRYEYDPVGNVLSVRNDAEATRFWRNQKIVPVSRYRYDSLYQLVSACGREMADIAPETSRLPSPTIPRPTNDGAFTNYTRRYRYDRGGNLICLVHSAPASNNSYTRYMTVSHRTNRAVLRTLTEDPAKVDALFDAAGNQLQLQPGQSIHWTPRGELDKVTLLAREETPPLQETYRYDAQHQRIGKISSHNNGAQTQRVLYLPGWELRTRSCGDALKEALHIIAISESGRARVLHWEKGVPSGIDNDAVRYSHADIIDSIGLELDESGQVISQEEYYPFGGTALWAARSQTEASYKTVRYSGKERDATGLYYYGYRYYQPWAGRWLSADPAGTIDGLNLYRMVRNNPTTLNDVMGLSPEGIYYEYNAMKNAPLILRETRLEVEAFLSSKRGTAALYVAGGTVREGLGTLAAMGGGALGSVVPVAGTFAGAYVAKKAVEKALPEFHAVPPMNAAKKIEQKSKGGLTHKLNTFRKENMNLEKLRDKVTDTGLNTGINKALEAVGEAALPVSIPFTSMYKGMKELRKSGNTSKGEVIRQLATDMAAAEQLIKKLDATIKAGFGALSVKREHRDPITGGSGFLEYCTRSGNHPTNANHWIRASKYERLYDKSMDELGKLQQLVSKHSRALQ